MSLMQKIGMKRLLFDGNSTRIDKSFLPCPKMGYFSERKYRFEPGMENVSGRSQLAKSQKNN